MSDLVPRGQDSVTLFQTDLVRDEKVLWTGQPEPKLFCSGDLFLVPFSLLFFCFSIFWILAASGLLSQSHKLSMFWLFGIPFVLIGFYLLIGRFFVKSWKQRNTYYAVTNQRALVLCTVPNRSLQSVFINTLPSINKSVGSNGSGTLVFGYMPPRAATYVNSGMDFFASVNGQTLPPAFYDVKDANYVCELINGQRRRDQK
jgi:hypothetical protein